MPLERNEKGQFIKGHTHEWFPGPTNTNFKKQAMYRDIFNWLKENVKTPELYVNEDGSNQYMVNIWLTILNHDPNMFDPKAQYALEYANAFIRVVTAYIPNYTPPEDFYHHRWVDPVVEPEFCAWFIQKKKELENYMSNEYFTRGKMKDNEILKRRFKRTWSEQKIVDAKVEADQNIKSDNKIEINIKDA